MKSSIGNLLLLDTLFFILISVCTFIDKFSKKVSKLFWFRKLLDNYHQLLYFSKIRLESFQLIWRRSFRFLFSLYKINDINVMIKNKRKKLKVFLRYEFYFLNVAWMPYDGLTNPTNWFILYHFYPMECRIVIISTHHVHWRYGSNSNFFN